MKLEIVECLVFFVLLINIILALINQNIHSVIGWGYGTAMFYFWLEISKNSEDKK